MRAVGHAPALPLVALCALTVLVSGIEGLAVARGVDTPDTTQLIWTLGFSLFIAWWVELDRRGRGYGAPFEFSAFVFLAWPILVPYYLHKTRGLAGLLWGVAVIVFFFVPYGVAIATYIALGGEL